MKKSGTAGRSGLCERFEEGVLVFAGQEDDVIDTLADHAVGAAIKLHRGQRKIGVLKLLPVKLFAVAVVAGDRTLLIVMDLERPDLKRLCLDSLLVFLGNGDDVEQPIGAAMLGDALGT